MGGPSDPHAFLRLFSGGHPAFSGCTTRRSAGRRLNRAPLVGSRGRRTCASGDLDFTSPCVQGRVLADTMFEFLSLEFTHHPARFVAARVLGRALACLRLPHGSTVTVVRSCKEARCIFGSERTETCHPGNLAETHASERHTAHIRAHSLVHGVVCAQHRCASIDACQRLGTSVASGNLWDLWAL